MKEIEKKNWLKLYEIAEKIKELEPWKELWDTDLFVYIEDNDVDNSLYFCTMGRAGIHKSVAIYKGDQIDGYLTISESGMESIAAINYQECVKVCYLDREDTLPENRKLIKELGLKYRGTWTSFEKFEIGYDFGTINNDEVIFMTKALENYYEMFKKYRNEKMSIDFHNGEGLIRKYNTKTKKFEDVVEDVIYVSKKMPSVTLDKDYKKITNKTKKTNLEFEIDFLNNLPVRIDDYKSNDGRYMFPLIFIIADRNNQFIFDMDTEKIPKDYNKYIKDSIDRIANVILQVGKPKTIYVRDKKTAYALKDFLEQTGIKIAIDPNLPAIEFAYEMFLNPPADFLE